MYEPVEGQRCEGGRRAGQKERGWRVQQCHHAGGWGAGVTQRSEVEQQKVGGGGGCREKREEEEEEC